MAGTGPWVAQSNVEPIAAVTIQAIANSYFYNVLSGVDATYNAGNLNITYASGTVTHNSTITGVAGNSVTLVADPTNPRWTYSYVNSSGVAAIVSGTAAATPAVPDPGANVTVQLTYVQAGLTIAANATYQLDKRVFANAVPSTTNLTGLTQKYKSGTQVFTTTTTFADVTASSGNFAFTVAANEVWQVEYYLPIDFGGTGGAKFQLTGPSAPTAVLIKGSYSAYIPAGSGDAAATRWAPISSTTAFSTPFAANNNGSTLGNYSSTTGLSDIRILATVINGANAGTVTLQAAQNSSNSTTTLGIGSYMRAYKVA